MSRYLQRVACLAPSSAVAAIIAVIGSGGAAAALIGAPSRTEAWLAVPWLVVWGVAAVALSLRRPADPPLLIVLVVATLVRLPFFATPVLLSDDLWRYLWEGRMLNAGLDPFAMAPAAVVGLDDALRDRVNHPEIASIYPPVALLWFRLLDLAGGTALVARVGATLADLGTIVALRAAGQRRGVEGAAWLWALHPLPAVESAHGGHLEAVAIALTVAAIAAGPGRRGFAAGVAATGLKLFPVVLLGPLLRPLGWSGRVIAIAAGTAALAALAAPVWGAGPALGFAAANYAQHWAFDAPVYPWLSPWLGEPTRPLLLVAFAGVVAVAWWREADPARVWASAGLAFVLLSPTVHPWYVLWALAPAVLLGQSALPLAAVASPLAYLVLRSFDTTTGRWDEGPGLWAATWLPFAALALIGRRLRPAP